MKSICNFLVMFVKSIAKWLKTGFVKYLQITWNLCMINIEKSPILLESRCVLLMPCWSSLGDNAPHTIDLSNLVDRATSSNWRSQVKSSHVFTILYLGNMKYYECMLICIRGFVHINWAPDKREPRVAKLPLEWFPPPAATRCAQPLIHFCHPCWPRLVKWLRNSIRKEKTAQRSPVLDMIPSDDFTAFL